MFASIVKNLPNPKHISVQTKSEKVHGEVITGYKVHAEIYANEAPELLLSFINNVSRDEKAIVQIVNAINELNAATGKTSNMTIAEFKDGLQQFKTEFAQSLPELKNVKLLSSKNYFKTDIFLDRNFYERKSSTDLNIVNIEDGSGLKGIRLLVDNETWNINEPVTAKKIRYSSYLTENATMEEFLATLDKKRSVLYKVLLKLAN